MGRRLLLYIIWTSLLIIVGGLFGIFGSASAAFNEQVNYQGKLTDTNNQAVSDGAYDFVFKLYTVGGGGSATWTESWLNSALWTETSITFTNDGCSSGVDKVAYTTGTNESSLAAGQYLWNITKAESAIIQSVDTINNWVCVYDTPSAWSNGDDATNRIYVKSGLFSVMLGTIASLSSIDFNQTLYLGVTVGADSEMKPRKVLGASPAAFEAKKLGGYTWAIPGTIGSGTPNTGAFTTLSASTSVTTPLLQTSSGALTVQTGASGGADDIIFKPATSEKLRIEEDGDLFFEKGTYDLTVSVTAPTGASRTLTIPALGADGNLAAYGGSLAGGDILYGATTNVMTRLTIGSTNYILTSSGSAPQWSSSITVTDLTCTDCLDFTEFEDTLDLDAANLTLNQTTYTWTQNFTGTTTTGLTYTAHALSTGSGLYIDSTSTAGDNYKLLNITSSGANAASSKTRYGVYVAMSGTGTTSTNVAGYFSASGATNNYGLIVENGNVGIGATSPVAKLHILGSNTDALRLQGAATNELADLFLGSSGQLNITTVPGSDTAGYIDIRTEDDLYGCVFRESDGTGTTAFLNLYVVDPVSGNDYVNLVMNTGQTTTGLVIDQNNNVGIGTAGPDRKLDVLDTTAAQLRLTYTDSTAYTDFQTDSGGDLNINPSGDDIFLDTANVLVYRASGDQSIEIGDANVAHGLTDIATSYDHVQIKGNSSTAGGARIAGITDEDSVTALHLYGILGITDPTDTIPAISLNAAKKNTTNVQSLASAETVLQVQNNNSALLTVLGDGKVGIGTTGPTHRLSISTDSTNPALRISGSPSAPVNSGLIISSVDEYAGAGTGENEGVISAGAGFTYSSGAIASWTAGDTSFGAFRMDGGTLNYYADTGLTIGNTFTPTSRFTILSTGNVGIGTTGPDRKLDVLDASNPQIRLTATDGSVYTDLQANSDGFFLVNATGSGVGFADGVSIGSSYYTATPPTNGLLVEGTVGIGTSGPDKKLDVLDASNPQLRLTQADGTVYSEFQTASTGSLTITTSATAGADDILFKPAGAEKLRIEEDGDLFFEKGTYDLTVSVTAPTGASRTLTIPALGADGNLAAYGGSLAAGDILYGATTNVMTRLTIGSTNNILTSSGTAPQWSSSITVTDLTCTDCLDFTEFEDTLDLDAADLILNQTTYTWTQNFTGTTTTGLTYNANSLTTGTGIYIASTSTAGGASGNTKLLSLARSGANANASHTAYGIYSTVTNTGTTSTNVAGYFSASGATNNYGLIVENGNVGIGITAPSEKLDISGGNIRWRETSYNTDNYILRGGATNDGIGYAGTVIGQNIDATLSSNAPKIAINTGGLTSAAAIHFNPDSNATNQVFGIWTGTGSVGTVLTPRLVVSKTGNVGINDTTPDALFDIDYTSTSATGAPEYASRLTLSDTGVVTSGTDTTYGHYLDLTRTGATGGTINTYGVYSTVTADNAGSGTSKAIGGYFSAVGADSNYGLIVENGNVGIGTATPGAKLDIASPSTGVTLRLGRYGGQPSIKSSEAYLIMDSNTNFAAINYYVNQPVILGYGGGNVGINTSGPDRKLDVLDASNPQIRLTATDGSVYTDLQANSDGFFLVNTTGAGIGFADGVSIGSSYYTVTPPTNGLLAEGTVGIGTSGPDRKLDVLLGDGNPQMRLTYTDSTAYSDFKTDSSGYFNIVPSGNNIIFGDTNNDITLTFRGKPESATASRINVYESTSTAGMYMRFDGSANYGYIGTNSGGTDYDSIRLTRDTGVIRFEKAVYFNDPTVDMSQVRTLTLGNSSSDGNTAFYGVIKDGTNTGIIQLAEGNTDYGGKLRYDANLNRFYIGTRSAATDYDTLYIARDTGIPDFLTNVGINTSGPDRKLDVLDTANPQLRLTYTDSTAYTDFKTDSGGDLNIDPSGDDISLDTANIVVYRASGDQSIEIGDANVAHGLTDIATTYDHVQIKGNDSSAGGARIAGITDQDSYTALHLYGILGITDPTDTIPAITLNAAKKNTTNVQSLASAETVLQVQNNTSALLTVLGDGKVGIGTTTPGSPLHIVGSCRIMETGDTSNFGIITASSDYLYIDSYGTAASSGGFVFRTNDAATTAMQILPGGNVGIGIASPSQKLEVNYGHLRMNVVSAPGACTAALAGLGAGNVDNGTHYYKIVFVTPYGETSLGTASNVVTVTDKTADGQVSLTNIPTGASDTGVTSRKIYRTKAGGTDYYYLATINNNTETTYTDNIADSSLTVDWDYKQNTTGGLIYGGGSRMFKVGTGDMGDVAIGYGALPDTTYPGGYNIAMGYSALGDNTTGTMNIALGTWAMDKNTSGDSNVAIGYNALAYNLSGVYDVAIGRNTLFSNTASYNTVVGAYGMFYNTSGANNFGLGYRALYYNTTGGNNIGMGGDSNYLNTTGTYNIGIGNNANYYNVTGSYNIGIGAASGPGYQPGSAPTATAVAGSGLNVGTYYYRVSFVLDGSETTLSIAATVTTTSGNQQVNLTAIPTYSGPLNCTARKIYRTKTGDPGNTYTKPYYLLTTIGNNSTTDYSDTTPDDSLGAVYDGPDNMIALGANVKTLASNQMVVGDINNKIIDSYWGSGIYGASPSDIAFNASGGSGTNNTGASFIIAGGRATGNAAGGSIIFKTSDAGASGTAAQSLTEKMRINVAGNVGINDTTPDAKFDIDYTSTVTTGANEYASRLTLSDTGVVTTGTDTTYGHYVDVTRTGATGGTIDTYGVYSTVTADTGTDKAVGGYFSASGAYTNYGLIVENGNVGIGTTAPAEKLEIVGDIRFSSVSNPTILFEDSGPAISSDVGADSLIFLTADGPKVRILNGGEVGIGDDTPDAKFDIDYTSTSTTGANEYASRLTLSDTGVVTTGTDTTYGHYVDVTRTGATGGTIDTYGVYSTVTADNAGSGTSKAIGGYFSAAGADSNYGLIVDAGNVGIGNTTPAVGLHIGTTGSNHSLTANNDLMVSGKLEVDGYTYLDSILYLGSYISMDNWLVMGSGANDTGGIRVDRTYQTAQAFEMGVPNDSQTFFITKYANKDKNHDHTDQSNPTLFIHSATDPDTANTQWISFTHDTNDGVITTGIGDIVLSPASNVGIGDSTPDAKFDIDYTSTSTTGANEYASRLTLSDTGVVTTGTDTTYGHYVDVTRTGATGGTIDTYGVYSNVTADNAGAGTSKAVGGYFSAAGADSNYSLFIGSGNLFFEKGTYDLTVSVTAPTGASRTLTIPALGADGNVAAYSGSLAAGDLLYGATTNAMARLTIGSTNNILTSSGTAPQWSSSITVTDLTCTDCLDFTEFEDTLDLDVNFTLNQSAYTWTQNFTGDTGTGLTYNANSLSSGTAVLIASTSTAGTASGYSYLLKLSRNGENANTAHTAYGLYATVDNTHNDTSGTNIAAYLSASGASTVNYGLLVENGNVGIGTTAPTYILSLGGDSAQTIWMERHTTAGQAGQGLTIKAGGAYSGGTDLTGGTLYLSSGIATGLGSSEIHFYTATAGVSGTADRSPTEKMRIVGNGNVGIGATASYRLTVRDSQATSYVAQIYNNDTGTSADALLISLGVANASRTTGNYFIGFSDGAGTVAGKIRGGASAVEYATTGTDLAEYFLIADLNQVPEAGELVTFDNQKARAVRKTEKQSDNPIGVVSTSPGFLGGGPLCSVEDQSCDESYEKFNVIVALIGQIPVKVSTENGPIEIGDYLTSSSEPGKAMKATSPGRTIGIALEPFDGNDEDGKILVFVNLSWYGGSLNEDGGLEDEVVNENGDGSFVEKIKQLISSLGVTIKDGIAWVKDLFVERLTVEKIIAKTARIEKIEMIDQVTGEAYCTWLERGEWIKVQAECDNIEYLNGQFIINEGVPIEPEPEPSEIAGCTDPEALNYNPQATMSDDTCEYQIKGCTDAKAVNYNPEAEVDDGLCLYESQPEPEIAPQPEPEPEQPQPEAPELGLESQPEPVPGPNPQAEQSQPQSEPISATEIEIIETIQ